MAMLFDEGSALSEDHHAAAQGPQRGPHHRRAVPRRHPGDHGPGVDGQRRRQRLVDFAAGLAFALRGSFDKVATKVFLLSPADVEVTPEERRRMARPASYAQ